MTIKKSLCVLMLLALIIELSACGGRATDAGSSVNVYTVGGTVSGFDSTSELVLYENGGDLLSISNSGAFTFKTPLASGAYSVTVGTQPTGQVCSVTNGVGVINSVNVVNVVVVCVTASRPTAPTPTVSYNNNPNRVILSWAPVSGATYYSISKNYTSASGYGLICQANSPNATTCIDTYTKLTDLINASYIVSACNALGCTASAVITAFTAQVIQYLKSSNADANDWFGYKVALSADGSTLAVGVYKEASGATGINGSQTDNSASDAGAVYVFIRSGSAWSQQAYIKASNTDAGDHFGYSLSLSGDGSALAVGANGEASNATGIDGNQLDNGVSNAGAVYVFVRSGSTWSQQAYIKASNTNAYDYFGGSVSLSFDGNTLAVGAATEASNSTSINGNQADNSAAGAGAVYVFTRSGGIWSQLAYIKPSNAAAGDFFGGYVALSGDGSTLAVGAYGEASNSTGINGNQADNSAAGAGAVYVFTRSGSNWSQQAYIKSSNTDGQDKFGGSVAISGDGSAIAVGAYGEASNTTGVNGVQENNSAQNAGAVYVFFRVGSTWVQQAYIKASNTNAGDGFSISLSLSADGSALAVGAWNESSNATGINGNQFDNSDSAAGAIYLFVRTGDTWTQQGYIKATNTNTGDAFGSSVALSSDGGTLAVGALGESSNAIGINGNQMDNSATQAGAVYVY